MSQTVAFFRSTVVTDAFVKDCEIAKCDVFCDHVASLEGRTPAQRADLRSSGYAEYEAWCSMLYPFVPASLCPSVPSSLPFLCKYPSHHFSRHIRQTEISARMSVGQ